jgi:predicted dehydrogenase
MQRRSFLPLSMAGLAQAQFTPARRYRAVIIGHTGRGNYGHEWDTAWKRIPAVEVTAVADPDDAGRAKAQQRSGAPRAYRDYREMLDREKPDVVTIAPRMLEERVPMVTAAAEAGAHILMEKPFARTLAEADAMVAAVEKRGVKAALGHTARVMGVTVRAAEALARGDIGQLLEIRGRGKEDRRAGGEDLIVLGTHVFDLMRYFAGDPAWIFSHVTEKGRELTPPMMRRATEDVGLVGGDNIAAMFLFPNGVHGYFASRANDFHEGRRFGVTLYGSRGFLYVPLNDVPSTPPWMLRAPGWTPEKDEKWERIPYPDTPPMTTRADANHAMALDLLAAIEQNRKPACDARDGLWTIEMTAAVYQSQWAGGKLAFPLAKRA